MLRARRWVTGGLVTALLAVAPAPLGVRPPGQEGRAGLRPSRDLAVRSSITPRVHLFGDVLTARVDVLLDRRKIEPDLLQFVSNFAPYRPVGDVRTGRRDGASLTRVAYTVRLRCLTVACLPRRVRRPFTFERATLGYRLRGAGAAPSRSVAIVWPRVAVVSRLPASEIAGREAFVRPPWRAALFPLPAVSYRVRPRVLAAASFAGASALVLLAGFLVLRYGRRHAAPLLRRRADLPPLERALALLEHARTEAGSSDQRKALELLALELHRSGEPLVAGAARELAWSEPAPMPEDLDRLSAAVRQAIAEQANGYRP